MVQVLGNFQKERDVTESEWNESAVFKHLNRACLNNVSTSSKCGMYGPLRAISYLHKRANEMLHHQAVPWGTARSKNQQTNSPFRWQIINKEWRPGPEGHNPMFSFHSAFLIRLKICRKPCLEKKGTRWWNTCFLCVMDVMGWKSSCQRCFDF